MAKQTNYHFFTEPSTKTKGHWVGRCKELPGIVYERANRDTALSGIRRTVLKLDATQFVAHTHDSSAQQLCTPSVVAKATCAGPVANTVRKINRVVFVIDRSSSMSGYMGDVINSLNMNLETLRSQEAITGQETHVAVVAFNSTVRVIRQLTPVNILKNIEKYEIRSEGMTALYDGTAHAIDVAIAPHMEKDANIDLSYLVITLTDGEENVSQRFGGVNGANDFANHLRKFQSTDRWTFSFLVPPGQASRTASSLGVPAGNITEWETSSRGAVKVAAQNSSAIGGYYTARSAGNGAMKSFYTDTNNVSKSSVVQNLVDIKTFVNIWKVDTTSQIRTFCERMTGRPFQTGAAFYELQKPEEVQDYKKFVLVDKNTGSVYTGANARSLLGLPSNGTIRLIPGTHTNFDVFVQSKSTNRNLYTGTRVIYYPGAV